MEPEWLAMACNSRPLCQGAVGLITEGSTVGPPYGEHAWQLRIVTQSRIILGEYWDKVR